MLQTPSSPPSLRQIQSQILTEVSTSAPVCSIIFLALTRNLAFSRIRRVRPATGRGRTGIEGHVLVTCPEGRVGLVVPYNKASLPPFREFLKGFSIVSNQGIIRPRPYRRGAGVVEQGCLLSSCPFNRGPWVRIPPSPPPTTPHTHPRYSPSVALHTHLPPSERPRGITDLG